MRRFIKRILIFAPRGLVIFIALTMVFAIIVLASGVLAGAVATMVGYIILLVMDIYLLRVTVQGWRHNRDAIKLRHQIRRALNKRQGKAAEMALVVESEQTVLLCYRNRFLGVRWFALVAITAPDDADAIDDWNAVFMQHSLYKVQFFSFPPLLTLVEHEVYLAGDQSGLPQKEKRHPLSASYLRDRLRQLDMDAGFAGAEELRWLLMLVQRGTPTRSQ
jgi:hypothetical protein